MRVLIVEDNKSIVKGLLYSFEQNGYETVHCDTYQNTLKAAPYDFDIIILDIALPDGNGFDLYSEIRKSSKAPVIFLTAVDDEDSIVNGFELGAEDYITKPFSTRELLARMKRAAAKSQSSNIVRIADITTDLDKMTVYRDGEQIDFTALEYRIFSLLVQNTGKIVTRELILEKIWDVAGNYVNDNTLTVYIKRIRQKLGKDIIKTVKGLGYKVEQQ